MKGKRAWTTDKVRPYLGTYRELDTSVCDGCRHIWPLKSFAKNGLHEIRENKQRVETSYRTAVIYVKIVTSIQIEK